MTVCREDSEALRAVRALPAMGKILTDSRLQPFQDALGQQAVKEICREVLDRWRQDLLERRRSYDEEALFAELVEALERRSSPSLRRVINGTGVVIHTNLGRSPLPPEALEAVRDCALGYSTLEYDLDRGGRGHRNAHLEPLLCQITGAEAAVVVNNNAAAVLLCLAALAAGREVVVSRGELVEIGGSFRIPDIMNFAGVKLVEVGCTNRTHLRDYAEAITDRTAMILRVHRSNFRIVGFQSQVPREELAQLAHSRGLAMMEDLGSGSLVDGQALDLTDEASVMETLKSGVDVVTFSGDKLLGGPQIGAILGRQDLVDRLRRYPLFRALRCDKMTLAAMEATLRLYLRGQWRRIPTLAMVAASSQELRRRAEELRWRIDEGLSRFGLITGLMEVEDAVGGGASPETVLPGWAVWLRPAQGSPSAGTLQQRLRRARVPVIAGAQDKALVIHLRTVSDQEMDQLLPSLAEALEASP